MRGIKKFWAENLQVFVIVIGLVFVSVQLYLCYSPLTRKGVKQATFEEVATAPTITGTVQNASYGFETQVLEDPQPLPTEEIRERRSFVRLMKGTANEMLKNLEGDTFTLEVNFLLPREDFNVYIWDDSIWTPEKAVFQASSDEATKVSENCYRFQVPRTVLENEYHNSGVMAAFVIYHQGRYSTNSHLRVISLEEAEEGKVLRFSVSPDFEALLH